MTDSKNNSITLPAGSYIDSTYTVPTSGTYTVHTNIFNYGLNEIQKEEVRQIIKEELLKQYNNDFVNKLKE